MIQLLYGVGCTLEFTVGDHDPVFRIRLFQLRSQLIKGLIIERCFSPG